MDNFQRTVGENIGYASMCWIPHPSGVFDSTQAQVAVDAIMAAHKAEIESLTAELAAAKKDSRRLDYMQKTCLAADFDYGERHECVWVFRLPEHIAIGANVRKNIDAALTDTPTQPLK